TLMDKVFHLTGSVSGQFPGMSPPLDIIATWAGYMANRNRFDYFRQRPIVPRTQWEAGGIPRFAGVLRWTSQQTGALRPLTEGAFDLLGKAHPAFAENDDQEKGFLEIVDRYGIPINALMGVSNYGLKERQYRQVEQVQAERAS